MAKSKRIFEIAKELGVKSTAIVKKCQEEEVSDSDKFNHMSVVKAGLEQTIRDWFGDIEKGQEATSVENAEKVDMKKARSPRRKAVVKPVEPEPQDAQPTVEASATDTVATPIASADVAVAEPNQDTVVSASVDAPSPAPSLQATTEPSTDAVDAPKASHASASKAKKSDAKNTHETASQPVTESSDQVDDASRSAVVGVPNVPVRPKIVKAVGKPLSKPASAVLRGPKVVRIEKPEVIEAPKPRRHSGAPNHSPNDPVDSVPGIKRSHGPARGRGAGNGGQVDQESQAKPKRRSLSTRRGRSAEALPTGPSKFSEQDLLELDARLRGAPGFLKQRRRSMKKTAEGAPIGGASATGGPVEIADPITIKSLSSTTGIKSSDIIKYLFKKGVMATINSAIESDVAIEIAMEYEIDLVVKEQQTVEEQVIHEFENREAIDSRLRPPVVTVLGHVDHGKTSLLDRIRQADVAHHEAGGITQHVGAYRVTVKGNDGEDKTVVFLDTPGHAAFTSMRARGTKMTDLVVLVVAADDGVMPQTIESINHAKAAGVPLIVALNKVDKPEANEANIRKIYGQLAEHGLSPTQWGGTTEVVKVSAMTGEGITDLLEMLDYQSELLELKADYAGTARGAVIETQMQPGRGPVARVLVQQGQLKLGDFIVIGRAYGRVRDMTDDRGRSITQAGPATPLELSGIDIIPDAGDKFYVTDTLQKAEHIAKLSRDREREKQLASQTKVRLDNFAAQLAAGGNKELNVVLKADVQGSIDVLRKSLAELGNKEVSVKVLHAAVGGITENDIVLADASDAIIVGFHVVAPSVVREMADQRGVDIRLYRIIYEVTDEVKLALEGLLEPETQEHEIGQAEVREVFRISKVGSVAGCLVTSGLIQRSSKVRLVRDDIVVVNNRNIETLRRVKDDAKEVRAGTECGIRIEGYDDIKVGDRIVCYRVESIARKL